MGVRQSVAEVEVKILPSELHIGLATLSVKVAVYVAESVNTSFFLEQQRTLDLGEEKQLVYAERD